MLSGVFIKEFAVLCFISVVGYINSYHWFYERRFAAIRATLSIPLGLVIYILLSVVLLFFNLPFTGGTILFSILLVTLISAYKMQRSKGFATNSLLIEIGVGFGICFVASIINASVLSYDSFAQINLGRTIVSVKGFSDSFIQPRLFSWGVGLPVLHASASWMGLEYHPAAAMALFLSLGGVCTASLVGVASDEPKTAHWALVLALVIAFFSSYFVLFNAFYIHNNLLAAVFLFCANISFLHSKRDCNGSLRILGVMFLIVFAMTRLENILIALIFLVPVLSAWEMAQKERVTLSLVFGIPIVAWYGKLAFAGLSTQNFETQIADPARIFLMLGVTILFSASLLLGLNKKTERLLRLLPLLLSAGVIIVVLVVAIASSGGFIRSARNLVINMFFGRGNWGILWFFILALFILTTPGRSNLSENPTLFMAKGALLSMGMLFFFVAFRSPFRLGWGDSGNRILLHFAPLLFYSFASRVASDYSAPVTRSEWRTNVFVFSVTLISVLSILSLPSGASNGLALEGGFAAKILRLITEQRATLAIVISGGILVCAAIFARLRRIHLHSAILALAVAVVAFNIASFHAINGNGHFSIRRKPDATLLSAISDIELKKYGFDREALRELKEKIGARAVRPVDDSGIALLNVLGAYYYPPDLGMKDPGKLPDPVPESAIELASGSWAVVESPTDEIDALILVSQNVPGGILYRFRAAEK